MFYKSVCKNSSLILWQIAMSSPTFATRSKKRDFLKTPRDGVEKIKYNEQTTFHYEACERGYCAT